MCQGPPFLEYWVTSKSEMGFSVREQELIILRMGVLYQYDYVWMHHVPVDREFGVSERLPWSGNPRCPGPSPNVRPRFSG